MIKIGGCDWKNEEENSGEICKKAIQAFFFGIEFFIDIPEKMKALTQGNFR